MIFSGKIAGHVRLEIVGSGTAPLLNDLMAREIPLGDLSFAGEGVEFTVPLAALKSVRECCRNYGVHPVICRRRGLPYWLKGMKRLRYSWLALAAVVCMLFIATSSLWKVEVAAEDGGSLSPELALEIKKVGADHGIHPLAFRGRLDYETAAEAILRQCPELAWAGFQTDGVTLTIVVVEKDREIETEQGVGNVVAAEDGVLRRLLVLRGQPGAAVGDTVKKGDLLISGEICYEEEGKEPVYVKTAAKGIAVASVWYEASAYVGLNTLVPETTGRTAGMITLTRGDKVYTLWGSEENPFEDFVVKKRRLVVFKNHITALTYCEALPEQGKLTYATAQRQARLKAEEQVKAMIPENAKILSRNMTELKDRKGAAGCCVIWEAEVEIGAFVPQGKGNF